MATKSLVTCLLLIAALFSLASATASSVAKSRLRCATADEMSHVSLNCEDDGVVIRIAFASFGAPEGACYAPAINSACHLDVSSDILATCRSSPTCSVLVSFPSDSCKDMPRSLTVTYECGEEEPISEADSGIPSKPLLMIDGIEPTPAPSTTTHQDSTPTTSSQTPSPTVTPRRSRTVPRRRQSRTPTRSRTRAAPTRRKTVTRRRTVPRRLTVTRRPTVSRRRIGTLRRPTASRRRPTVTTRRPTTTRRPSVTIRRPTVTRRRPTATRLLTIARTAITTRRRTIVTPRPITRTAVIKPSVKASPSRRITQRRRPGDGGGSDFCSECMSVTFGSPEYVRLPDEAEWAYPDFPFAAVRMPNGEFLAFSGKGTTQVVVKGPRLGDFLKPGIETDLDFPLPRTYYTHDLEGVWYDEGASLFRAWIHIETNTCGNKNYYHGEIFYSQSTDGIHWNPRVATYDPPDAYLQCPPVGPVHSDDWAITSSGSYIKSPAEVRASGTDNTGTGPHWVLPAGEFLYLFYNDFWAEDSLPGKVGNPDSGMCVARATKASGGRGGTWKKYYQGSFSTPGVGGSCSVLTTTRPTQRNVIQILGSHVSRVPLAGTDQFVYLNLPPACTGTFSVQPGGDSDVFDVERFQMMAGPIAPSIFPADGSSVWQPYDQRPIAKTWFFGYNSLAVDENDQVWMYAMVDIVGVPDDTPPRPPYPVRSIARWPLTISRTIDSSYTCAGFWSITRYRSLESQDEWLTIKPVMERYYKKVDVVGYISSCPPTVDRAIMLSECLIVDTGAHYAARPEECHKHASAPDGTDSKIKWLSSIGWASKIQSSGLIPLYRCYYGGSFFSYAYGRSCPNSPIREVLLAYVQDPNVAPGSHYVFNDKPIAEQPAGSKNGQVPIYIGIAVGGGVVIAVISVAVWLLRRAALRRRTRAAMYEVEEAVVSLPAEGGVPKFTEVTVEIPC